MPSPIHRSATHLLLLLLLAIPANFLLHNQSSDARIHTAFDFERVIPGDDSRGPFLLGVTGLIPGSDSVRVDGILLTRGRDYVLVADLTGIELTEPLLRGQELTLTASRSLQVARTVRRRELPSDQPPRILSTFRSSQTSDTAQRPVNNSADGEGIEITGVKRLQVAVGTTSEAALSQSLRLEISGQLSDGPESPGPGDRQVTLRAGSRPCSPGGRIAGIFGRSR